MGVAVNDWLRSGDGGAALGGKEDGREGEVRE